MFGETSFWFSKNVGKEGKVFCFEPVPENYKVLMENLEANQIENIIPVNMAVGETSGEIRILGSGGGATATDLGNKVPCTSLDEFVENQNLKRVNLIKMDIEGSEWNALIGASKTLKRFKPKLAISVYHGGRDIVRIPLFLFGQELGYKIFLRHFSLTISETIMFAKVN